MVSLSRIDGAGTHWAHRAASSAARPDMAGRYAIEIEWMEGKLDEARKLISTSQIVIPYDNGGGQTGVRANPAFVEYERLLGSWDKAVCGLMRCMDEKAAVTAENKVMDLRAKLKAV